MPKYEKPAGDQRNGHEISGSSVYELRSAMASQMYSISGKRAIIVNQLY